MVPPKVKTPVAKAIEIFQHDEAEYPMYHVNKDHTKTYDFVSNLVHEEYIGSLGNDDYALFLYSSGRKIVSTTKGKDGKDRKIRYVQDENGEFVPDTGVTNKPYLAIGVKHGADGEYYPKMLGIPLKAIPEFIASFQRGLPNLVKAESK